MSESLRTELYNVAFIDGGSRGNPGPAASAYTISIDGRHVRSSAKYLGVGTNNDAEYMALISLLEHIASVKPPFSGPLTVFSDSKLVVNQMTGRWAVKDSKIKGLVGRSRDIVDTIDSRQIINLAYIPRSFNREADKAVNNALDSAKCLILREGQTIQWQNPVSCHKDDWASEILSKLVYKTAGLCDRIAPAPRPRPLANWGRG